MLDSALGNIRHIDMPRPPDRDETGGAPTASSLPLWPEDAAIELFHQQPTMGAIRFSDTAIYIEELRAEIETQALNRERTEPIAGGAFKLHDVDQWTSPAANLVTARADGIVKVAPLLGWTSRDLFQYVKKFGLPNNFDYYDPTKGEEDRECGLHLAH